MNLKLTALATVCLLTPLAVFAETTESTDLTNNIYVGAFVGQSSFDASGGDFDGLSVDDSDTAFKFLAGYQFNDYLSLEGGYANLGELTISAHEVEGPYEFKVDGSVEVDGLFVNVVGSYPVSEQFSLYAKVGLFSWDAESELKSSFSSSDPEIPSESYSESFSDDGSDVFYGVGLTYHWNEISFRAEYEMFESDGDDVDVFSIGAVYNF